MNPHYEQAMNILVLCWKPRRSVVRTHDNHLFSFRRYGKGNRFYYFNCKNTGRLPAGLANIPFDAVIFHYTFLALRFDQPSFWAMYKRIKPVLQGLQGVKVIIPHDEYVYTRSLWTLIRDCGVQRVYSSCFPPDCDVIFPAGETGQKNLCHPVFTGYIDPATLRWVEKRRAKSPRKDIDVGYRAGSANYIFGFHGQLKTDLANAFRARLPQHPHLKEDVKLTYMDSFRNTITGSAWFDFLLRCRAALGCLGGSSILDPDGEIRARTLAYVRAHPGASREEIAQACYQGGEGVIQTRILGPRVFECAMTHTCQLLVEGDYFGVLEPNVDYIPIKKDFSNLDEVMDLVERDPAYCEKIAEQCYEHVVASGKYSYEKFVEEVLCDLRALVGQRAGPGPGGPLAVSLGFYRLNGCFMAQEAARVILRKARTAARRLYGGLRGLLASAAKACMPKTYARLRAAYRARKKR